jgi:hypothetical protein
MERMLDKLYSASADELCNLYNMLSDEDINQIMESLPLCNAVWNVEVFADKVGFADKGNAFRYASQKNLIDSEMLLKDAVGKTYDEKDQAIINPVPSNLSVLPTSRTRVRFMTPRNLMEWLMACHTKSAEKLRRSLVWTYALHTREKLQQEVASACQQLDAMKREVKQAPRKTDASTTAARVFKIFKYCDEPIYVSVQRKSATLTSRVKTLSKAGFAEMTGVPTYARASSVWSAFMGSMKKRNHCVKAHVPGGKSYVYAHRYNPVTPAVIEDVIKQLGLSASDDEWLRTTLGALDGIVDVTQKTMGAYMQPMPMPNK